MGGFMGSTLMRWIMYGWMCSMIREWIWSYYGIHSRSTIITREFGMLIYVFRGVSNYSVGCGWFMEKIWETRSVNLDRILNRQQCRPICWITTRMLRRDERERDVSNSYAKTPNPKKPRVSSHVKAMRSMQQECCITWGINARWVKIPTNKLLIRRADQIINRMQSKLII